MVWSNACFFFIARPDQKIHMSRTLALNAPTTPQKQPQRKLLNSNAPHPSTWHQTVHSLYVAFRKHVLGLRRLQRGLGKLHSSQCSVARCTSTELVEIPNPDIFQAKERSPGLRPGSLANSLPSALRTPSTFFSRRHVASYALD